MINYKHLTLRKISIKNNIHSLNNINHNMIQSFSFEENSGTCQSLGDAVLRNLTQTKIIKNFENIYADNIGEINIEEVELN